MRHILGTIAARAASLAAESDSLLAGMTFDTAQQMVSMSSQLGVALDMTEIMRVATKPTAHDMRTGTSSQGG